MKVWQKSKISVILEPRHGMMKLVLYHTILFILVCSKIFIKKAKDNFKKLVRVSQPRSENK